MEKDVVKKLEALLLSLPDQQHDSDDSNMSTRDFNSEWYLFHELQNYEKKVAAIRNDKNDLAEECMASIEMGETYVKKGFPAEANNVLLTAVQRIEDSTVDSVVPVKLQFYHTKLKFQLAETFFSLKKDATAISHFEDALKSAAELADSNHELTLQCKFLYAEILLKKGLRLFSASNYAQAADHFTKCLRNVISPVAEDNNNNAEEEAIDDWDLAFEDDTTTTTTTTSASGNKANDNPPPAHQTAEILHSELYREACYQIALCLKNLNHKKLALEYGLRSASVQKKEGKADDRATKLVNELKKELEEAAKPKKKVWVEEDEDEDWGSFGAVSAPSTSASSGGGLAGFKNLFKKVEEEKDLMDQELFSTDFRFTSSEIPDHNNNNSNISKKVVAPRFYSLKTNEGEDALEASVHKEWLSTIISKHQIPVDANKDMPEPDLMDIMEALLSDLKPVTRYSYDWARMYYTYAWRLYHAGSKYSAACWQILSHFFSELPSAAVKTDPSISDEKFAKHLTGLFNISLAIFRIAAGLWKPENNQGFIRMKSALLEFMPNHADSISLIEIQAYCHNIHLLEGGSEHYLNFIIPGLLKIYENHCHIIDYPEQPPPGQKRRTPRRRSYVPHDKKNLVEQVITIEFGETGDNNNNNNSISNDNSVGFGKYEAAPLPLPSCFEVYPSSLEVLSRAVFTVHALFNQRSPIDLKVQDSFDYNYIFTQDLDDFGDSARSIVESSTTRINLIKQLYSNCIASGDASVLYSELLAMLAYSLSLHYQVSEDDYSTLNVRGSELAERLLFECIYILDGLEPLVHSVAPIMSRFAVQALSDYGAVLMRNSKYPFAVLAYEAAIHNYPLVYPDDSRSLRTRISDLALLCWNNNDWERTTKYFQLILDKARADKAINEIIHASENLSKMFLERGDFRSAAEYLKLSVTMLKELNGGKLDNNYALTIQLGLSDVYLQSYYFEPGIDLLVKLMGENLLPPQHAAVMCHLALAYLKKKWLTECEFVLTKLAGILTQAVMMSLRSTYGFDEIRLIEIAARCCYHQGQYASALAWADEALQRCTSSNMQILGRFFAFKGKVFHQLLKSTTPIKFPTELSPDSIQKDAFFVALKSKKPKRSTHIHTKGSLADVHVVNIKTFNNHGDFLMACLQYYQKSIEYFKVLGDETRRAKTEARIAQAQLDFAFAPVALFGISPEDVVCFQRSEVAAAAAATTTTTAPAAITAKPATTVPTSVITLAGIEQVAVSALKVSMKTRNVLLALDLYCTMAELRWLQGRKVSSSKFWSECRNIIFNLFMDDCEVVLSKGAPPSFMVKLFAVLKRLVRLMFCYQSVEIDVNLIDAFLLLEIELNMVQKRPRDSSPDFPSHDSETSVSPPSIMTSAGASTYNPRPSTPSTPTEDSTLDLSSNKIYEALSPDTKTSVKNLLPFLRKNVKRKGGSLRNMRLRFPNITASGSNSGSNHSTASNGSQSSPSYDIMASALRTELLTEKAWSCFYRMRQNARMFSVGKLAEHDLSQKNERALKVLLRIMHEIRAKDGGRDRLSTSSLSSTDSVGSYPSPPTSLRTDYKNSAGRKRAHSISNSSGHNSLKGSDSDRRRSRSHNESNSSWFAKLINEEIDDKSQLSSIAAETAVRSFSSIPVEVFNNLVYCLHLDDVLLFFTPLTGKQSVRRLGGRDETCMKSYDNNRSAQYSTIPSRAIEKIQRTHGNFSTAVLEQNVRDYIQAIFLQSRFEAMPNKGVEASETIADELRELLRVPVDEISHLKSEGTTLRTSASSPSLPSRDAPKVHGKSRTARTMKTLFKRQEKERSDINNVHADFMDPHAFETEPLIFICSHSIQLFPWEVILKDVVTRDFSLKTLLGRRRINMETFNNKPRTVPSFFSFYSDDSAKAIAPPERQRKEWIANKSLYDIHHAETQPAVFYESMPNIPLHNPLVKYGASIKTYSNKYKYIHFCKLSMILQNPTDIVTHISSCLEHFEYPVLLFTFADFIDLSEVITFLMSYRPDCCMLFIPEACMKTAVRRIIKFQDRRVTKTGQFVRERSSGSGSGSGSIGSSSNNNNNSQLFSIAGSVAEVEELPPALPLVPADPVAQHQQAALGHKYFMSIITKLQKEWHLPVVVVNPPLLNYYNNSCSSSNKGSTSSNGSTGSNGNHNVNSL